MEDLNGSDNVSKGPLEPIQIISPVVCFAAIILLNLRYLQVHTSKNPNKHRGPPCVPTRNYSDEDAIFFNYRTFFEGIRSQWVREQFYRGQVPVQTLRDYISVSCAFGGASLLFISIMVGLSKTGYVIDSCVGRVCSPQATLAFIRYSAVIVNFAVVFFNFLLALRYTLNVSFLVNTPVLDGTPLPPSLTARVLSRAHLHYTLGLRGIFLSLPLVAWLFGHFTLIAMTLVYLISLYVWEDDTLTAELVWADKNGDGTTA